MSKAKFEWTADKQVFVSFIVIAFIILSLCAFQYFNHKKYCTDQGYENTTDWEMVYDPGHEIDSVFFECNQDYRFESKYTVTNYTDKWGNLKTNGSYITERLK